jgi:hypothetical protein
MNSLPKKTKRVRKKGTTDLLEQREWVETFGVEKLALKIFLPLIFLPKPSFGLLSFLSASLPSS